MADQPRPVFGAEFVSGFISSFTHIALNKELHLTAMSLLRLNQTIACYLTVADSQLVMVKMCLPCMRQDKAATPSSRLCVPSWGQPRPDGGRGRCLNMGESRGGESDLNGPSGC